MTREWTAEEIARGWRFPDRGEVFPRNPDVDAWEAREREIARKRAAAERASFERWLTEFPRFGPPKPIPERICECCLKTYRGGCCL